jgi:hypothetical protein
MGIAHQVFRISTDFEFGKRSIIRAAKPSPEARELAKITLTRSLLKGK